jgi:DNA-binding NarL/FixJ family response regulator
MELYRRGRKLNGGETGVYELQGFAEREAEARDAVLVVDVGKFPPLTKSFNDDNTIVNPRRIAVIESRSLLRDCFSMFFSTLYDSTIEAFENVDEMLRSHEPDQHKLIVMGWNGNSRQLMLGQLSKLCRECGHSPVIVMQDDCDYALVCEALRAGARGVVTTALSADVATEAIGMVMAGGSFIPAESMMQPSNQSRPQVNPKTRLTAREGQVLELLKAGKQNKQIAFSLSLSEGTVKVHLHNMMKKLGTTNRTQTIVAATEFKNA